MITIELKTKQHHLADLPISVALPRADGLDFLHSICSLHIFFQCCSERRIEVTSILFILIIDCNRFIHKKSLVYLAFWTATNLCHKRSLIKKLYNKLIILKGLISKDSLLFSANFMCSANFCTIWAGGTEMRNGLC